MFVAGIEELQRQLNVVNEAHRESLRRDRIVKKELRAEIKQLKGTIETLQFVVELNKKYALKLGASISDW